MKIHEFKKQKKKQKKFSGYPTQEIYEVQTFGIKILCFPVQDMPRILC